MINSGCIEIGSQTVQSNALLKSFFLISAAKSLKIKFDLDNKTSVFKRKNKYPYVGVPIKDLIDKLFDKRPFFWIWKM